MSLTPRETEVLRLVSQGNSYKKIASILRLSVPTIKVYTQRAKSKLGANNCSHAVAIFIQGKF